METIVAAPIAGPHPCAGLESYEEEFLHPAKAMNIRAVGAFQARPSSVGLNQLGPLRIRAASP